MEPVELGKKLTLIDIVKVATFGAPVVIPGDTRRKIEQAHNAYLEALQKGVEIYGVTTGLGELVKVKTVAQGSRMIIEHAVGVGDRSPREWVRAALLIRAHQLALGYSGVKPAVVEMLAELLNRDITPVVPMYGSVGASGDLAPLSHIALALLGEGYVEYKGEIVPAEEALRKEGLEPLLLDPRDALALINGTSFSTAVLALAIAKVENLLGKYLAYLPLYLHAVRANYKALLPETQVKRHYGMKKIAEAIQYATPGKRLHDPYSVRCIPQVLGPLYDVLKWAREVVENEINSPSDNPIFTDRGPVPTCHFHGQYVAMAADSLATALAIWANLLERQIAQLLRSDITGKPEFLVKEPGSVGDMIYHYTAASLVAKIRTLATPYSVQNIPTSGFQEDVNSMSLGAAIRIHEIIRLLIDILSIHSVVTHDATDCTDCQLHIEKIYSTISDLVKKSTIPSDRIKAVSAIWS
ncbi:Histidine ammonia-lyase [Pyrobaculum oguniense TE7]|uniref:Histidine ammonia-lyase n=1 Tax=Pyrobaculum oguniense (strain DSM 13380 / JCM 10595 / TE7) TaxID=698757 RepID=H6Q7K7_PYROT|nr:Histidine ammonia-lyase [Pyrobaculum oguniense TE7]